MTGGYVLNEGRVNKIVAVALFILLAFIYLSTVAPTLSFWDCGEFISCASSWEFPIRPDRLSSHSSVG